MTRRFTRTLAAEHDLAEIIAHIAADSPRAALKLARTFDAKAQLLAEFPGGGTPYPRRRARFFPVGEYLILYRETADGIVMLRYYHGRRDRNRL